jgi:hypothetical protein
MLTTNLSGRGVLMKKALKFGLFRVQLTNFGFKSSVVNSNKQNIS